MHHMRRLALLAVLAVSGPALAEDTPKKTPIPKGKKLIVERVVAVVNDSIILESELRARLIPVMQEVSEIADPKERERRLAKLQGQVLDDMVNEDLIVQAAEAAKIDVDSSEVQAALDEIKSQNKLDDAALNQVLAAQGFTMTNYRSDLRRQLLRLRAVNQLVAPKVSITEDDVRARYDQLQRRSDSISSVKLSHIQIKLPPNPTEQQITEAKERAAKAIQRIKGGEAFAAVAAEMSDDTTTKTTGGELGWFQRGSINADLESVVFSMEKGDVRGPIFSEDKGLEVFQVTEVKKSDLKPFNEMKDQIQRDLKRREMEKQTQAWIEDLRKKAYIDIKL